ncbi:UDP-N-acetylmuramoyl-tripeptide--D-alanyl-D-alanine ligase [Anaeromyxobacter terrae]|uniref:UDP-N-acetylmuramoyl-tripeptide--D-alanyl-D- alanine ligase n=1 Tax=Anaeromyxobacter terrae TaxID=2925406 RepID=UPI001F591AF4|nr:UDP-N-acetylmuramoyl-tripeptide--D-alanyl-D-alanine ligase [Anaeromyxobacter sp. SG22]
MTVPRFSSEELAAATGGRWIGAPPAEVAGVSTDTRTIAPGALFVALVGERFDAHGYLAEAAARGAVAAVVADGRAPAGAPLPLLSVPDTLPALGAIARHHRRRFHIPVVGVTGSNGKTTTREMIAAILGTRGPALKTEGNLNNEVGVPLTLLGLGPEHRSAVVEMGMNHPGEIARLAAIAEPYVGVVTLAAPAHLEGLGTVDAVADAKAELYRGLPETGIVIANADDPRMLRRAQASGHRMLTFAAAAGRRGDVVVLEIASQGDDGLRFVLGIGNREVAVHIPALVGAHNAANAAAAAAAGVALGCSDREIAQGLAAVRPVGRRLRLDRLPSGLRLVDDCYNANPSSMSAALRTLVDLARPDARPVAVLGDMLELGAFEEEAHRALGAEAARAGVSLLAAFGPRARSTAEAARAAGLETFHTDDMDALVRWARTALAPSMDVLLVKGSRGMKLERLVEALR